MRTGTMEYVQPEDEKFKHKTFEVSDFEVEIVGDQVVDVYQKIKNKEFSSGCNEDDCKWCTFVNENFKLNFSEEEVEEDDR